MNEWMRERKRSACLKKNTCKKAHLLYHTKRLAIAHLIIGTCKHFLFPTNVISAIIDVMTVLCWRMKVWMHLRMYRDIFYLFNDNAAIIKCVNKSQYVTFVVYTIYVDTLQHTLTRYKTNPPFSERCCSTHTLLAFTWLTGNTCPQVDDEVYRHFICDKLLKMLE